MFRWFKRKIRHIEYISTAFMGLFLLQNIKTIANIIFTLFILMVIGTILYSIIKQTYIGIKYRNKEYTEDELINMIQNLSPREFELFCSNMFRELGYRSHVTVETLDGGKDVILKDDNGETIYVECKHWREEIVPRDVVQKLIGSCVGDKVGKAIFITTSNYTDRAKEYANNIDWLELWTMKDIIKAMNKIEKQWVVLYDLKEC